MRFGACVPAAAAADAAAMGYEYVEIPAPDLAPGGDEAAFAPTAKAIATAGIPALAVNYLVPATTPVVGPAVDLPALRAYIRVVAERAASLGVRVLVMGSGPARRVPDGFAHETAETQFRDFIRMAGEEAAKHDLTVAIEALNRTETNLIHTLEDAAAVASEIAHPAVGVLADAYHMHMAGEPFWHLLPARHLLRHVQVCDVGRGYPGSRSMDLWALFIHLNHIGYDGTVSVECRWTSFAAEGAPALEFVRTISTTSGELAFAP
jgi:sugar phosphate isomerase/epimerase